MKYLTFILGAGASVPYGLPTGDQLVRRVASHMIASQDERDRVLGNKLELYDPLSIDSYLIKHYSNDAVSLQSYKAYIAFEIMSSLQHAWFGSSPTELEKGYKRFSAHNQQNWLRFLVHELLDLYEKNQTAECPIKIVSFNYDLSIEFYLERIIRRSHLEKATQDNFLRWFSAAIVHVYGQVGGYDWQSHFDPQAMHVWCNTMNYSWANNKRLNSVDLMQNAWSLEKNIRMIGEPCRQDDGSASKAKEWIENSQTLVFSGYAFHGDNNRVLELSETSRSALNIIVGLYGENNRTETEVRNLFKTGINQVTKKYEQRREVFNPNTPASPVFNLHKMTTYDMLKHEVTLSEHYSLKN